jgi:ankyrin repeat protein
VRRCVCGGAQRGNTPLHCAVDAGSVTIARLLLDRGAFKDNKDSVRASRATRCRGAPLHRR